MLRAENISYKIGEKYLVKDFSCSIAGGEFVVIMGQNGAGKSTLLKMFAGSLKPTEGKAFFNEKNIEEIKETELAKRRSVLSQHYDVSFPISVEDIVMMGRYPHFKNSPAKRDYIICSSSLKLMGMAGFKQRDYNTLSGGEAQKVQMARVLSQIWMEEGDKEKILFLDEPVSNLDMHYQYHILTEAKKLALSGAVVVAVLHDINLAFHFAERIIFMKDGIAKYAVRTSDAVNKKLIEEIFDINIELIENPHSPKPLFFVKS